MKRSHMLKKIREVLDYELPPAFVHDDVAKEILKEIEKQGMTPPDWGETKTIESGVKVVHIARIWEKE